jgi:hypothetical protein
MVSVTHHKNKGSQVKKFADGGFVSGVAKGFGSSYAKRDKKRKEDEKEDDPDSGLSGMVPKALHKLWGMIPSAADVAVTGKLSATPEEYDKAREEKDAEIDRRKKLAK